MCHKTSRATRWVVGMLLGMTHAVMASSSAHAQHASTPPRGALTTWHGACGTEAWAQRWSNLALAAVLPNAPDTDIRVTMTNEPKGGVRVTSILVSSSGSKHATQVIQSPTAKNCAFDVAEAAVNQAQTLVNVVPENTLEFTDYTVDIKSNAALAECKDEQLFKRFFNLARSRIPFSAPTPKRVTLWLEGDVTSGAAVEGVLTSQDFKQCIAGSKFPEAAPTSCGFILGDAASRLASPPSAGRRAVCESIVNARNLLQSHEEQSRTNHGPLLPAAVKTASENAWMIPPPGVGETVATNLNMAQAKPWEPGIRVGLGPVLATSLNRDDLDIGAKLFVDVRPLRNMNFMASLSHFDTSPVWKNRQGVVAYVLGFDVATFGGCWRPKLFLGMCSEVQSWQLLVRGINVKYPHEGRAFTPALGAKLFLEPQWQLPANTRLHFYLEVSSALMPLRITSFGRTVWRSYGGWFDNGALGEVGAVLSLPINQ